MGCKNSCSSGGGCSPSGCGSKGHCTSGSCNRLNSYDWLAGFGDYGIGNKAEIVEVSFRQGFRKAFHIKPAELEAVTGDIVAVESAAGGYDIGHISMSGELVKAQMKRKRVKDATTFTPLIRIANERDLERLESARSMEKDLMIKARAIAKVLNLDMKIGDVEFQGDQKKATFYYIADGRVDFRELIKRYAGEFKIRVEMRQIGARQESALIGGLGPCGRELCCSTWLHDFKSVSTAAARYQNLAINQSKLSGQCGRLKCCLNYELNAYIEAFKEFPKGCDRLEVSEGTLELLKTDIFKRLMFYTLREVRFGKIYPIHIDRVREIKEQNKRGVKPSEIGEVSNLPKKNTEVEEEPDHGFEDVTGQIELKPLSKNKNKKQRPKNARDRRPEGPVGENKPSPKENRPPQDRGNRPPQSQGNRPPQGGGNKPPQGPSRPPQDRPKGGPPQHGKKDVKFNDRNRDNKNNDPK